jgi:hypothetical protein
VTLAATPLAQHAHNVKQRTDRGAASRLPKSRKGRRVPYPTYNSLFVLTHASVASQNPNSWMPRPSLGMTTERVRDFDDSAECFLW